MRKSTWAALAAGSVFLSRATAAPNSGGDGVSTAVSTRDVNSTTQASASGHSLYPSHAAPFDNDTRSTAGPVSSIPDQLTIDQTPKDRRLDARSERGFQASENVQDQIEQSSRNPAGVSEVSEESPVTKEDEWKPKDKSEAHAWYDDHDHQHQNGWKASRKHASAGALLVCNCVGTAIVCVLCRKRRRGRNSGRLGAEEQGILYGDS